MAGGLQERDAQTFIDAVHEVRYHCSTSSGGLNDVARLFIIFVGVGDSQSCTENPKEAPESTIQDLCSSQSTPKITAYRVTRHFNGSSPVRCRVWGCVEEGISGAGGCDQGVEETR